MTASVFSDAMGEISEKYIMEAVSYQPKKKHIIWPRVRSAAACFLLAVFLTGSAILTFSVEARATFFGWVREQYEVFYEYFFEGEAAVTDPEKYELGWLPEGYTFFSSYEIPGGEGIVYTDENDYVVSFTYTSNISGGTAFFVDGVDYEQKSVTVNGCHADVYIATDANQTSSIVWTSGETLFYISAPLDETGLITMAENIRAKV